MRERERDNPLNLSGEDPRRRPRGEDAGVLDVARRAGHPWLGARRQRHRLRRPPRAEEVQEELAKVQGESKTKFLTALA